MSGLLKLCSVLTIFKVFFCWPNVLPETKVLYLYGLTRADGIQEEVGQHRECTSATKQPQGWIV